MAGLLARGLVPFVAFPGHRPVAVDEQLAAYSCGDSAGIGEVISRRTGFPFHLSEERTIVVTIAAPVGNVNKAPCTGTVEFAVGRVAHDRDVGRIIRLE
jgi:hypothetical protein